MSGSAHLRNLKSLQQARATMARIGGTRRGQSDHLFRLSEGCYLLRPSVRQTPASCFDKFCVTYLGHLVMSWFLGKMRRARQHRCECSTVGGRRIRRRLVLRCHRSQARGFPRLNGFILDTTCRRSSQSLRSRGKGSACLVGLVLCHAGGTA